MPIAVKMYHGKFGEKRKFKFKAKLYITKKTRKSNKQGYAGKFTEREL